MKCHCITSLPSFFVEHMEHLAEKWSFKGGILWKRCDLSCRTDRDFTERKDGRLVMQWYFHGKWWSISGILMIISVYSSSNHTSSSNHSVYIHYYSVYIHYYSLWFDELLPSQLTHSLSYGNPWGFPGNPDQQMANWGISAIFMS